MPRRPALAPVPGSANRRPVTAAGSHVRLDDAAGVKQALSLRADWQDLAWDYYDSIGEIKHAIGYLADAVRQLPLYAGRINPDGQGPPIPSTSPAAEASLDRLRGVSGGHGEILRETAIHLSVPGACWLIGLAARKNSEGADTPERWFVASLSEVATSSGKTTIEDPDTGAKIVMRGAKDIGVGEDADFIGRIWRRHPRKSSVADSALRGVLAACEELLIVDRAFRALARSRISMGKIVYVPDDLDFPAPTDPSAADPGDFMTQMMDAFIAPIADEGNASAVAPIVLTGPRAEGGSGIEVISIDRDAQRLLQTRGETALRRIAQGINVPVEVVFGLGQANHWGAGQIEIQTFRQYIAPLAEAIVESWTAAYHRPTLLAAGMSADEVAEEVIWYDDTVFGGGEGLDPQTRLASAAGYQMGLIGGDAWRRANGYGPDDVPKPGEAPPPAISGPAVVAAARPDNLGQRLADIDLALWFRLEAAADATVREAIRKVGNRLASRAQRDTRTAAAVADVAPEMVAATLGRTLVASIEDPADTIATTVATLADRFTRWTAAAQRQALDLVPDLDPSERQVIEAQQSTDRLNAWAWLSGQLTDLINERLYDPTHDNEAEVDIPFAIVREAMARAGGSGGVTAALPLIAIAIGAGVAVGAVLLKAFRDHGVMVAGHTWRHDGPPKPFDPHVDLNGVPFESFTDDVLYNPLTFPIGDYYFPGDHAGCRCQAVPTMIRKED